MASYKNNKKSVGLKGGPNEYLTHISDLFSVEGYKADSPDVNNPYNIIQSGNITMEGVDFPVIGTDNLGNEKLMTPGNNYQFPGDQVFEVPLSSKQVGGSLPRYQGDKGASETSYNPIQRFKNNLAENLHPYNYDNSISQVWDAGVLGNPSAFRDPSMSDNQDYVGYQEGEDSYRDERIDLLHMLMGKEQITNSIEESIYKPTDSENKDAKYYRSKTTERDIVMDLYQANGSAYPPYEGDTTTLIDLINKIPSEKGKSKHVHNNILNTYQLSRGEDKKGSYIAYYDEWDVNPFKKYNKTLGDLSDFVTEDILKLTPPEIYGRIYYDKKTGEFLNTEELNKKQYGGDLPKEFFKKLDKSTLDQDVNWYNSTGNTQFLPTAQEGLESDIEYPVLHRDTKKHPYGNPKWRNLRSFLGLKGMNKNQRERYTEDKDDIAEWNNRPIPELTSEERSYQRDLDDEERIHRKTLENILPRGIFVEEAINDLKLRQEPSYIKELDRLNRLEYPAHYEKLDAEKAAKAEAEKNQKRYGGDLPKAQEGYEFYKPIDKVGDYNEHTTNYPATSSVTAHHEYEANANPNEIDITNEKRQLVRKLQSPAFRNRYRENYKLVTGEYPSEEELDARLQQQSALTSDGPDYSLQYPYIENLEDTRFGGIDIKGSGLDRSPVVNPFNSEINPLSLAGNAIAQQHDRKSAYGLDGSYSAQSTPSSIIRNGYVKELSELTGVSKLDIKKMSDKEIEQLAIDNNFQMPHIAQYPWMISESMDEYGNRANFGQGNVPKSTSILTTHELGHTYNAGDSQLWNSRAFGYDENAPYDHFNNALRDYGSLDVEGSAEERTPYDNWIKDLLGDSATGWHAGQPAEISSAKAETEARMLNAGLWDAAGDTPFSSEDFDNFMNSEDFQHSPEALGHLNAMGAMDLKRFMKSRNKYQLEQDAYNSGDSKFRSEYLQRFKNKDYQKFYDEQGYTKEEVLEMYNSDKKRKNKKATQFYDEFDAEFGPEHMQGIDKKLQYRNEHIRTNEGDVRSKLDKYFNMLAQNEGQSTEPTMARYGGALPEAQVGTFLKSALKQAPKYADDALKYIDDAAKYVDDYLSNSTTPLIDELLSTARTENIIGPRVVDVTGDSGKSLGYRLGTLPSKRLLKSIHHTGEDLSGNIINELFPNGLFHGSPNVFDTPIIDNITELKANQVGKKNSIPGFYSSPDPRYSRVYMAWIDNKIATGGAQGHLKKIKEAGTNTQLYNFKLKPDAKVFNFNEDAKHSINDGHFISDLTPAARKKLSEEGYDAVLGIGLGGKSELIMLSDRSIVDFTRMSENAYNIDNAFYGRPRPNNVTNTNPPVHRNSYTGVSSIDDINVQDLLDKGLITNEQYGGEQLPEAQLGAFLRSAVKQAPKFIDDAAKYLDDAAKYVNNYFNPPKKSSADWTSVNKSILDNKILLQEYQLIEETTKANGTWMKNADGSAFQGTPELFIQSKSTNFQNAFPDGFQTVYRGMESPSSNLLNDVNISVVDGDGSKMIKGTGAFAGDIGLGERYVGQNENSPLYQLAMRNSDNSIEIPGLGSDWLNITNPYMKKKESLIRELQLNIKALENARLAKANGNTQYTDYFFYNADKRNKELANVILNYDDVVANKNYVELAKWWDNPKTRVGGTYSDEVNKILGYTERDVSTDDLAIYLQQTGLDNLRIPNIMDGGRGNVYINNQVPGNYLKSLTNNNGEFDLSRPSQFERDGGESLPQAQLGAFFRSIAKKAPKYMDDAARWIDNLLTDSARKVKTDGYLETMKPMLNSSVEKQKAWLNSEEYIIRKQAGTGLSREQIIKDRNKIIKKLDEVKFDMWFEEDPNYADEGYLAVYKPDLNRIEIGADKGDVKGSIDHEVKHAGSELSIFADAFFPVTRKIRSDRFFNNYPTVEIGDDYLDSGQEQQVRFLRMMESIEADQGIKKGTPLTLENLQAYVDKVKKSPGYLRNISGEGSGPYPYSDVDSMLGQMHITHGPDYLKKLLPVINKAWLALPAAGVGTVLANQKYGGSLPKAQFGAFNDWLSSGADYVVDAYEDVSDTVEDAYNSVADTAGDVLTDVQTSVNPYNYRRTDNSNNPLDAFMSGDFEKYPTYYEDNKDEAFSKARADLGPGEMFLYDGIRYETDHEGETTHTGSNDFLAKMEEAVEVGTIRPDVFDRFKEIWTELGQPDLEAGKDKYDNILSGRSSWKDLGLRADDHVNPFTDKLYIKEYKTESAASWMRAVINELTHVKQQREMGRVPYMTKYIQDIGSAYLKTGNTDDAQSSLYNKDGTLENDAHRSEHNLNDVLRNYIYHGIRRSDMTEEEYEKALWEIDNVKPMGFTKKQYGGSSNFTEQTRMREGSYNKGREHILDPRFKNAQDGKEITTWGDYINPMNWGVTDRDDDGTFDQAFEAARKANEEEFMWYGTRYNTNREGEENLYKGLNKVSTQRRKDLKDAIDTVVSSQGNDDNLEALLTMTAFMENTYGGDKKAYGRSYTRGPMSIDDIAFNDLTEPRGEKSTENLTGLVQNQKNTNMWLSSLGILDAQQDSSITSTDLDTILRSDNALAGVAAARAQYGRVSAPLPDRNDYTAMYNYYMDHYNRTDADHSVRFKRGYDKFILPKEKNGGERKANKHVISSKNTLVDKPVKLKKDGETESNVMYKDYVNGTYSGHEMEYKAEKNYDKLNRLHYNDAKTKGMSVSNYILTHIID